MLLIVAHHFCVHGGFSYSNDHLVNKGFLVLFGSGGKIGVNVFVMISGYFLIKSKFSVKKLVKYVMQIWSYGIGILGIALIFHMEQMSTRDIVRYILPLGYMNWFAHAYLLMFILFPFINVMLLNMEKKLYARFLVVGFSLWYIIPTVTGLVGLRLDMGASILMDFIYLYSVGAYMRLFCGESCFKKCGCKAIGLYCSIVFLDILATLIKVHYIKGNLFYFADINSALALLASIYLFLWFKQMRISYSFMINSIASTTFGIYLLHDSNLLRKFIWHDALHVNQLYADALMPIYAVMIVVLVFSLCGVIEFLRINIVEKWYMKKVKKYID